MMLASWPSIRIVCLPLMIQGLGAAALTLFLAADCAAQQPYPRTVRSVNAELTWPDAGRPLAISQSHGIAADHPGWPTNASATIASNFDAPRGGGYGTPIPSTGYAPRQNLIQPETVPWRVMPTIPGHIRVAGAEQPGHESPPLPVPAVSPVLPGFTSAAVPDPSSAAASASPTAPTAEAGPVDLDAILNSEAEATAYPGLASDVAQRAWEALATDDPVPLCGPPTLGTERIAWAPFAIQSSRPGNMTVIGYDLLNNISRPDRSAFWWKQIGKGGPSQKETGLDLRELSLYHETGTESASAFFRIPLRMLNPDRNPNTSGLGTVEIGAKAILFKGSDFYWIPTPGRPCDRFRISSVMSTHLSLAPSLAERGLQNGLTALEAGLLFAWDACPDLVQWTGEGLDSTGSRPRVCRQHFSLGSRCQLCPWVHPRRHSGLHAVCADFHTGIPRRHLPWRQREHHGQSSQSDWRVCPQRHNRASALNGGERRPGPGRNAEPVESSNRRQRCPRTAPLLPVTFRIVMPLSSPVRGIPRRERGRPDQAKRSSASARLRRSESLKRFFV